MKAVQIGAGRIGRGFLAQLYSEAGYDVTFIDSNVGLVWQLNEKGSYTIEIVEPWSEIRITGFRAVSPETDEAVEALALADIASTSVGARALQSIAPLLAAAAHKRGRPLDLILAENLHDASRHMQEWTHLEGKIGFVEASVGRMVPVQTPEEVERDPLRIRVEAFCDLPVDADAFLGPTPPIRQLQPRSNFVAYVERKLYVHNAGHAAAAYLGFNAGHTYIWEAMEDPDVAEDVRQAMHESARALHLRHGIPWPELEDHINDLCRRFASRPLADTVARVGADPIRKLGRRERLIGAIEMCLDQGIEPPALAKVAAAGLRFEDRDLGPMISQLGPCTALCEITGLPENSPILAPIFACLS